MRIENWAVCAAVLSAILMPTTSRAADKQQITAKECEEKFLPKDLPGYENCMSHVYSVKPDQRDRGSNPTANSTVQEPYSAGGGTGYGSGAVIKTAPAAPADVK